VIAHKVWSWYRITSGCLEWCPVFLWKKILAHCFSCSVYFKQIRTFSFWRWRFLSSGVGQTPDFFYSSRAITVLNT